MCSICERLEETKKGNDPFLVHEFENSYFVIGDHQFFKGYCQVIYKECVKDLTSLDSDNQSSLFLEVMRAASALEKVMKPHRMNYSSLGNVVQHIHFHLFPRQKDELDSVSQKDPWFYSSDFSKFKTDLNEVQKLISLLRKELQ